MQYFSGNKIRLGILGAGQLGKMLGQAASDWHLHTLAMDSLEDSPARGYVTEFLRGDITDYQNVLDFGRRCDVVTIEIENVNVEALYQLQKEGVSIHPSPQAIEKIRDKGIQKDFFLKNNLPSSPFRLYEKKEELQAALQIQEETFPMVVKLRTGGYDGKGVFILRENSQLADLPNVPIVVENLVDIDKEIAVIAAKNTRGEIVCYDPVEMVFDPKANLVDYLLSPASISNNTIHEAKVLAEKTIASFEVNGLLAVEMFLTKEGNLLINEVAPRPHNSGHHSIDACVTSQFQQHIRGVLNLPLGDTQTLCPSLMMNILGADNFTGPVRYHGIDHILGLKGTNVYLYGKTNTKPRRKMGHITILDPNLENLKTTMQYIKDHFSVIA
jgi:5-(carboxyamino)imidazole ribonucleotide synthase